MNEPMTFVERRDKRAQIRDRQRAIADREALRLHRTLKCAPHGAYPGRHAGEPDGCANDGSFCLCECHDPKGPQ